MATALVVTACAASDGGDGGGRSACPVAALDQASAEGPVEIQFWHAMTAHSQALRGLTEEFNGSQERVQVELVDNTSYETQQQRYREGLETGELPDLVQHQESWLQQMVDTRSTLPVEACIAGTDFDTSDFVDPALRYYQVDGVQQALPFDLTTPVLLYNRDLFAAAGLDPDEPPTTLEELRLAAEDIGAAGIDGATGMGLKVDGWLFEQLLALRGELFVDHDNGRDGRATAVAFDSDAGEETFAYLADLVAQGSAVTLPQAGPGQFDNLLGVGAGRFGMTLDSTAALGTVLEVLQTGQYADADLAVAPMPGQTGEGGVTVGGGALYISATDEAKQAAAWEYMAFLTSPQSQATWAAATGYLPVRESATDLPAVRTRWAEVPGLQAAYQQLIESPGNDAAAGPVMGDLASVRTVVGEILSQMLLTGRDPAMALADAAQMANEIVEDYNRRIGA